MGKQVAGMSRHGSLFRVAAVVSFWALAVALAPPLAAADQVRDRAAGASADGTPRTLDDVFAAVAVQVPGFAGVAVDERSGRLLVSMAEPSGSVGQAQRALVAELGEPRVARLAAVRVDVEYDFLELKRWYDRMSPAVLALPGVVVTDIDERLNRLRVGVIDPRTHGGEVRALSRRLGVPPEVLVVEQHGPVRFASSLRNAHRPMVGGLQIEFGVSLCTLGFIADRQGVRGFVTNSHCTIVQGGVEGTSYTQGNLVAGFETVDPEYFTGSGCPAGRECRWSDSAFANIFLAQESWRGRVARPAAGSTAWNGVSTFRIRAEGNPLNGATVDKVGRTTGLTSGTVQNTCVTVNVVGDPFTFFCQALATYRLDRGDSGSPVLERDFGTSSDRTLVGITWGSVVGGPNDGWAIFSPLQNVQRFDELGPMATCDVAFTC
ncbi:MAG: hypothetical protein ACRDT4_17495 [Micromonosporaceae bacterium]